MLSSHTVARAAQNAGIEAPVRFAEVTGSTKDDLLRLAEEGAPPWTVLAANHQEQGRGRLGRTWVSRPSASLLVSVLLRPDLPAGDAALVTLGAGACMALACSVACGVEAGCKWPNDIVGRGRKLGGILVEAKLEGASVDHLVIGTRVNLEQAEDDFPEELRGRATSAAIEGGRPNSATLLFEYLFRLKRFYDPAKPGFRDTVIDLYRRHCDTSTDRSGPPRPQDKRWRERPRGWMRTAIWSSRDRVGRRGSVSARSFTWSDDRSRSPLVALPGRAGYGPAVPFPR